MIVEEKIPATAAVAADAPEESGIVEFSRPYFFEGKEYKEIDLSGIDNLTAEDMIAADKFMSKSGSFSVMPEMTLEYACFISARATSLPIEFFRRLPPRDAVKVKNKVTSFFYGEE